MLDLHSQASDCAAPMPSEDQLVNRIRPMALHDQSAIVKAEETDHLVATEALCFAS